MLICIICKYKKSSTDSVSFHQFPKNDKLRQRWISAIGLENLATQLKKSSQLCSQHFEDDCFFYKLGGNKKRRFIKPDAVPTIFGFNYSRKEAAYTEISSNVCIADQDIPKTEPTNKSTSSADQIRSSLQDHRSDINNPNTDCNERNPQLDDRLLESPRKKKHCSSLHFGDCYIQKYPFMAAHKLQITTKTVNDQKRKIRTLQQQVLRLKKKVSDMKSLITELREKQMISEQAEKMISVRT
ncbi:THAP domain-containing protein 2 [Camponotus japonicus]